MSGRTSRLVRSARALEAHPSLVRAARALRAQLPGDSDFGDPLSTGGPRAWQLLGSRLAEVTDKRPGLLREAGLGALQVWEHVAEAQGRGRGKTDVAIVFTDLVEFSSWAVEAGDDAALALLRDVGRAVEPPVREGGGEVVKRLGDGMMAVFAGAPEAIDAVLEASRRLREVRADGYVPRLRAGIHVGRPRRLGGDYLGVDVTVAARLAQEAAPDEVLVSGAVLPWAEHLDAARRTSFAVKGVPGDVEAFAVRFA